MNLTQNINKEMEIHLNNEQYGVEAFSMSRTYGGLLAGKITRELNLDYVSRLRSPKNWGDRKLTVIPPSEKELDRYLPEFECFVWITKYNDTNTLDSPDGTQAFIAWFDDGKGDLENKLKTTLSKLDWSQCSQEFYI